MHQFYPELGSGTEKFVLNMSKMMQNLGHKVKVITYSFYDETLYEQNGLGKIMFRELVYKKVPVIAIKYRKNRADLNFNLPDLNIEQDLKTIIKDEKPDIVHVGHSMRVHHLVDVCLSLNVPYILTLTDFFLICPKVNLITSGGNLCAGPEGGNTCLNLCPEIPGKKLLQHLKLSKEYLSKAKMVASPSKFVASVIKKEYANLKVRVINHGISFDNVRNNRRRYQRGDNIVFCYAGTLIKHKGVHVLLDAFKKIESEKAVLKIYGSGPDETYVDNLIKMSEKDKRIEFCGVFSEEQFGDILSNIDVVVIPSLCYETYSMTLHESHACSVPVIASNVGVFAEKLKYGVNGFTFKIGDAKHLKTIIEEIIENPTVLNEIKSNIENMIIPTIEQEAYNYKNAYRDIVRHTE